MVVASAEIKGKFFHNNKGIYLPRYLVYGWRRGTFYLYIGRSSSGKERFLYGHHVVDKVEPIRNTDFIDVWYCEKYELEGLELKLIKHYQPTYNIYGTANSRGTRFEASKEMIRTAQIIESNSKMKARLMAERAI